MFDRVSYVKLINKLVMYGVNVNIIGWVKNYLSDRTSCVRVNGCLSDRFKVTSGVPQGSVLGPILFVIYVNDMFEVVSGKSVELYLYADSAKLIKNITSNNDRIVLQSCLDALNVWCNSWEIKMNVDKCAVMRYGDVLEIGENNCE